MTGKNSDHAWLIGLHADAEGLARARAVLSDAELERAARFAFATVAERWILAHAACRRILARYLDKDPRALIFAENDNGKPCLAGTPGRSRLYFNFSRSHQYALLAISYHSEIGADIEHCAAIDDLESVARRFFCPAERRTILALSGAQRVQAFYRCWTRKEAILKASGKGLRVALNSFEVSLQDRPRPRLISVADDEAEAVRWSLHHYASDAYIAAVAYRDAPRNLRWFIEPSKEPSPAFASISRSAEKCPGI